MTITSPVSMQKSCKKGFTLTEIAIVLGIIGLILGAVWSAASGVYAGANATKVSQQIGQYVAAVRSACSNGCNSTTVPTTTQSPPTLPGAVVTPAINGTFTHLLLDFTNLPSGNTTVGFCNGLSSAVTNFGGVVAATSAAAETVINGNTAATCAGTTVTCPNLGTTYTYTAPPGMTCNSASVATNPGSCSYASKNLCATTGASTQTVGMSIPLSF